MLVGIALFVASCGTTRGGHCDAYGNVQSTPTEDLAQK